MAGTPSDNRPRPYMGMLAAAALRGLAAPVYPDVPPQELEFYAGSGRARFALAEDQEQVDKLFELRQRAGIPETIVCDDARGLSQYRQPGLVASEELIARGRLAGTPDLEADIIDRAKPTDAVRDVNGLLPGALAIGRFVNLPKEFDPDDGEVTRTRKLRRNVVEERYAPVIAALYDGSTTVEHETLITYETGATGTLKRRLVVQAVSA